MSREDERTQVLSIVADAGRNYWRRLDVGAIGVGGGAATRWRNWELPCSLPGTNLTIERASAARRAYEEMVITSCCTDIE
jgi:hypothetical protein